MKYIAKIWGVPVGIVYEYRRGPVPFIRCRRGSSYGARYYKKPRTMQERRSYFLDEDSHVRLRSRRSVRNLPEYWDDRMRSDYGHRSWKRHRRTQYKT